MSNSKKSGQFYMVCLLLCFHSISGLPPKEGDQITKESVEKYLQEPNFTYKRIQEDLSKLKLEEIKKLKQIVNDLPLSEKKLKLYEITDWFVSLPGFINDIVEWRKQNKAYDGLFEENRGSKEDMNIRDNLYRLKSLGWLESCPFATDEMKEQCKKMGKEVDDLLGNYR